MKSKLKRNIALFLCLLIIMALMPMSVFALTECIVDSNDTASYFQRLGGSGTWTDLTTPHHTVRGSGEVAYCMQHRNGSPNGTNYVEVNPNSIYSPRTLRGLQIIFEYGYPCGSPSNMTADQARYATANAIRFWLAEEGDPSQYNYSNRVERPGSIRAKSGYQHVLDWADSLVELARNQTPMPHNVYFNPSSLAMTVSGDYFVGTTTVILENCNGGYTLDTSGLPGGTIVDGYTGNDGDRLTIKVPKQYGNQSLRLDVQGKDNRVTANMLWFSPKSGSDQRIAYIEKNYAPASGAVFRMTTPAYGKIQITKTDSETSYKLANAVFGIYSNSACSAEVERITTNSSGVALSGDLIMGTYYVKEITAPNGYVVNPTVYTADVTTTTYTIDVTNKPQVGTITVTKQDLETGNNPQSDSTLFGAKYEIRNSNNVVVDTLSALGTRVVTSRTLPLGTYTVIEIAPPLGYLLNPDPKTVTLSYGGQNVEIVTGNTTVQDTVKKGKISIVKFGSRELNGSDPDPDIKPPLENVEFEIRLKSSGVLYDTLITDADGKATSKLLPYGTYVVSETKGIDGYIKILPFEVFVSENNKTYSYILENKTIALMVKLVKQDKDTGKTIPIAGTTFRIENSKGETVSFNILYPNPHTLSEFVTDESGTLFLPDTLSYGTYTLHEVKAPDGYLLNSIPKTFKVDEENSENRVITVTLSDTAVKGKIQIEKIGEVLSGYSTKETEYGLLHTPIYQKQGIEDVVFEVYAAENIGTLDGTVYYRAGMKVAELTTDKDGKAITDELYLGKYYVIEKSVPNGFVLDTTQHVVELKYENQLAPVVVKIFTLENLRQKAKVEVEKTAEYFDYSNADFYTDIGEGFTFGLYDEEDRLFEILITDENGQATSTTDLPLGEYYLKELDVPYGYICSPTQHIIDLTSKNNINAIFSVKINVKNLMIKKYISVIKTDKNDFKMKLENAVFEVLNDETVITEFMTNEYGYGISPKLPLGKYVLREKAAPTGYILSDETYEIELNETSDTIVSIHLTNEPTIATIEKIDSYLNTPIPNVEFSLFDYDNNIVKLIETDNGYLIPSDDGNDTFFVDEYGKAEIRYLPIDEYSLYEIAPSGYISSESYALSISDESNPNNALIFNAPTALRVFKVHNETKNPITGAGFSFKIETESGFNTLKFIQLDNGFYKADENGDISDVMVDDNGELLILCLPLGEVWIEETIVPQGYFPISPIKITIADEHTVETPFEVVIENAPFVKLGLDTDKYNVFITIGLCLFIVGGLIFLYVRKRNR